MINSVDMIKSRTKKYNDEFKKKSNEALIDEFEKEIQEFNFYIKNKQITVKDKNVLQAIGTTIKFVVFTPTIKFDESLNVFLIGNIIHPAKFIDDLEKHFLLFKEFDSQKVNHKRWSIKFLTPTKVTITFNLYNKISESEGEIRRFQSSAFEARKKGWKGLLVIAPLSSNRQTYPFN